MFALKCQTIKNMFLTSEPVVSYCFQVDISRILVYLYVTNVNVLYDNIKTLCLKKFL